MSAVARSPGLTAEQKEQIANVLDQIAASFRDQPWPILKG